MGSSAFSIDPPDNPTTTGGRFSVEPPAPVKPLEDEFAKSLGLAGADDTWGDIARQSFRNLVNGVQASYHQAQAVTGESGKSPAGSPFSLALTAPNAIANGIENTASLLHSSVPMVLSDDPETRQRGLGRLLAGAATVGMGMENPSGDFATRLTDYTPRSLQEMQTGTGQISPFNFFQGSINRSVGALARDVRYGDPSQALVQEGINSPSTGGRLYSASQRLGFLKPQLDSVLSQSQTPVDILGSITPIIDQATKDITNSFETDATKAAAHADLNALWTNALAKAPSGITDALNANEIKQGIGDSVNWGKRPTPQMPIVEDAYRQAYGAIKNAVFQAAPGSQGLMGRVSNLLALKNALTTEAENAKAGRGGGTALSIPQAVESGAGRVAPGAINTAQSLARVPVRAPLVSTLATGTQYPFPGASDGMTVTAPGGDQK